MGLCKRGYQLQDAHNKSHLYGTDIDEALAHEQYSHHLQTCPFCQNYRQELFEQSKVAVHPEYREESEA